MRFNLLDTILFSLMLIFVSCFPYSRLGIELIYQNIIAIGLRLLVLIYYIYIIYRNRIKIFGIANIKNILICVPFLIACFSNLIAYKIDGGQLISPRINTPIFITDIIIVFLTALLEEIVFRLFIHTSLTRVGSIKRILGSAGIFALMHLINIVNVSSVDALVSLLIQVVYTFGLGLMLGFLYEYSHSLTACVVLHFIFNMLNSFLVSYFMTGISEMAMYLTAVVIAAILLIYSCLVYYYHLRGNEKYFRE